MQNADRPNPPIHLPALGRSTCNYETSSYPKRCQQSRNSVSLLIDTATAQLEKRPPVAQHQVQRPLKRSTRTGHTTPVTQFTTTKPTKQAVFRPPNLPVWSASISYVDNALAVFVLPVRIALSRHNRQKSKKTLKNALAAPVAMDRLTSNAGVLA